MARFLIAGRFSAGDLPSAIQPSGGRNASNERPTLEVPVAAEWKPGFDPALATDVWIATVPVAERKKSDAYFEGGYWMDFGATLVALLVAWLLLANRASLARCGSRSTTTC